MDFHLRHAALTPLWCKCGSHSNFELSNVYCDGTVILLKFTLKSHNTVLVFFLWFLKSNFTVFINSLNIICFHKIKFLLAWTSPTLLLAISVQATRISVLVHILLYKYVQGVLFTMVLTLLTRPYPCVTHAGASSVCLQPSALALGQIYSILMSLTLKIFHIFLMLFLVCWNCPLTETLLDCRIPIHNFLFPDIPLTPRERLILEGSAGGIAVRSSHSTESILDSVSTTPHPEPPPKPPRPVR